MSLSHGYFPERMKIAKVMPIHKSGDKHIFTNYRQISLLPLFSKIFSKIFKIKLQDLIEKNNILTNNQFGFRRKRSKAMALAYLNEQITTAVHNRLEQPAFS